MLMHSQDDADRQDDDLRTVDWSESPIWMHVYRSDAQLTLTSRQLNGAATATETWAADSNWPVA